MIGPAATGPAREGSSQVTPIPLLTIAFTGEQRVRPAGGEAETHMSRPFCRITRDSVGSTGARGGAPLPMVGLRARATWTVVRFIDRREAERSPIRSGIGSESTEQNLASPGGNGSLALDWLAFLVADRKDLAMKHLSLLSRRHS
jgi:hypothetical protein